ncbi:MAG: NRDE family protein [Amphritea sp.]
MCLIVFAYKYHPEYNLILAANRDEFYARATRPLHQWPAQPNILAGQDLEQGGTWLGVNTDGRFSALTNHRDGSRKLSGKRSRGHLPLDFLNSTLDAEQFAKQTQNADIAYDGYNQLVGDNQNLFYLSSSRQDSQRVAPGIHGVSNARLNTPWPKLLQQKELLRQHIDDNQHQPEQLIRIMNNPQTYADALLPDTGISMDWERALSASFIQMKQYGTRATTIIRQRYDGETEIIEQNYDAKGATEQHSYTLQLPVIGGISRES